MNDDYLTLFLLSLMYCQSVGSLRKLSSPFFKNCNCYSMLNGNKLIWDLFQNMSLLLCRISSILSLLSLWVILETKRQTILKIFPLVDTMSVMLVVDVVVNNFYIQVIKGNPNISLTDRRLWKVCLDVSSLLLVGIFSRGLPDAGDVH